MGVMDVSVGIGQAFQKPNTEENQIASLCQSLSDPAKTRLFKHSEEEGGLIHKLSEWMCSCIGIMSVD